MKRTIQDLAQMSVEPSLSSIMSHCFNPFSSFSWFSFLKQIIQTATATGKDRTNKTLSRLDLIDAHTPQASVLSSIRLLVTTNPESPFEVRARYRTVILAKSLRESGIDCYMFILCGTASSSFKPRLAFSLAVSGLSSLHLCVSLIHCVS